MGLAALTPGVLLRGLFAAGLSLDDHTALANLPLNIEKTIQLREALDAAPARLQPVDVDSAMDFAFAFTDGSLYFGMQHETSRHFPSETREGNCVEYAHLFATTFNAAAERAGVDARAQPVRSRATLFGQAVPVPGWGSHDWVLIHDPDGATRYVDPTFHDAVILSWDLERNVVEPEALRS